MQKCPKCNRPYVWNDEKFCSSCGTELVPTDKCPGCGTELSPYWKYCTKCGLKVEEEPKL